ncbi:phenylacetate--CoA ligase [Pseudonocardia ailaonensis]|uniref:Phenylacetate--CoA ligase n=1 Tax=Pseudonocardia ailaonensis TaxID=367279 RepID=A0ABN2NLR9_9PSEU
MTSLLPSRRRSREDRLSRFPRYRDEERETMPPAQRDRVILERVQAQLQRAYHELPFYRRHYDAHGFHPDQVRTLADFTEKVPVITKKMLVADQAEHPPFGSYLGIERRDLARVHGSSGTSGKPTMYGVSMKDWKRAGEASALGLWCAGFRPDDLVQITFPFSLFFGGWGNVQAFELLGAGAFPPGSMVPTERQVELLDELSIDALVGTPSYLTHMARRSAELGRDPRDSAVGLLLVGGEPGGSLPEVRATLSELWGGADVIDGAAGSCSEMYPFLTNIGCLEDPDGGVHLFQDENYTEIVAKDDPNVGVPPGTAGGTVATHLWRESQPMIRFWIGDEGVLTDDGCRCGRTYPKLPRGVFGRLDDMLVIRGANVYPSAIEAAVRSVDGASGEFRVIVERRGTLDELTVEVEPDVDVPAGSRETLRTDLERALAHAVTVRVPVTIVDPGTHETQTFKARRVIDRR